MNRWRHPVKVMEWRGGEVTGALPYSRMVSLGKLSAGLAHELNNPAAAIERSATLLEDRLDEAERATLGSAPRASTTRSSRP